MDLQSRKRIVIERKLAALDSEFKRWQDRQVEKSWEKHGRQITAVMAQLAGLRKLVSAELGEGKPLEDAREVLRMSLAVHRIWEFFRSKLAQRLEPTYREYLVLVDELAWACYQPVVAAGVLKEPPLVFFNGGTSPFILTRQAGVEPETVPREFIEGEAFEEAMERLPFPVIGVPWNQSAHLAEAVVVAHEVGHSVEVDLKLGKTIRRVIKQALGGDAAENLAEWDSWASEIFADVWGNLSVGPAFTHALLDFLGADSAFKGTQPVIARYPPAWLRLQVNLAVLSKIDFASEAGQLQADVQGIFPTPPQYEVFFEQAKQVGEKLVTERFDELGQSLKETYCFSVDQQKDAKLQADNAVDNKSMKVSEDIRLWFAAAQYEFKSSPDGFEREQPHRNSPKVLIQKRIEQCILPGRRRSERELTAEEKKKHLQRDQDAAAALFKMWKRTAAP